MTLHLFNPEHDIALAVNKASYTATRIVHQMAEQLAILPMWWADEGDIVLVNNVRCDENLGLCRDVRFVSWNELRDLKIDRIEPWGWDMAIKKKLIMAGVSTGILPSDEKLDVLRMLSSRRLAVEALNEFRLNGDFVGESVFCETESSVFEIIREWNDVVLKAPWSCSGRGLKWINGDVTEATRGWIRNVIGKQGGVEVERRIDKVSDFAMEYYIDSKGCIWYAGLSLFDSSSSGAYTGNILNGKICDVDLNSIREMHIDFLSRRIAPHYSGPVGIDMMKTRDGKVNPCVEINLRRTMGHAALALEKCGFEGRFMVGYKMEIPDKAQLLVPKVDGYTAFIC